MKYLLISAVLFLEGCAFFSDGAVVDYSRMFNFSPVFAVGGDVSEEPLGPDYKQHRVFEGAAPWSEVEIQGTVFKHYQNHTVTCNTIGGITFCN